MSSSNKICYGLCAIVILAAIVPYVGLIPAGHWQDEFYNFSRLHDCGLSYLLTRLGWSLRPFSELLVFAYAEAVLTTNRPLVESALMLIWLITALIMFAVPARFAASSRTLVMLASAAIGALFLLDHPTAEMFYWPMASFAYMPTIAAIVAVCWLAVLDGIVSSNTRRTAAILLIVAASSLEIGAMFVVCMTGIAGVVFTISAYRREWRNTAWLIGPFIISAGILALMYAGRVSHGKELMGNAAIVHHIQPALKLAIIPFFKTALSSDWATRSNLSIALAMIGKAFTFAAFYGIARVISRNRMDFFTINYQRPQTAQELSSAKTESIRWLIILFLTCSVTVYLTIAASLYQFGIPGCERQNTFCQCLIYLSLILAACALGIQKGPMSHSKIAKFLLCLATAVTIPLILSARAIANDYTRYAEFQAVRIANWNRGQASGSPMLYEQCTPGKIVGGIIIKEKTYTLKDPETGWWIEGVIKFFHKDAVTFKTSN